MKRIHYAVAAIVSAGILASYLSGNVANPFFWFDAAGQIFMSLGIDPFAAPFAGPGSLSDSIEMNLIGNMDPGGFTLLMRYWAMMSLDPAWLRTLPLLFLLGALGALFSHVLRSTNDIFLAAVLALFPLTNPLIAQWGLTPRAYSMEMFGAVVAALLCYYRGADKRTILGSLALLACFATSRYSFLFVVFSFLAALFVCSRETIKLRFSWKFVTIAFTAALPVAIPLFWHIQNKVTYISRFVLARKDFGEILQILQTNFSRIETLLQIAFFLLYSALPSSDPEKARHRMFFWFLLFANLCYVGVSALGIYPWYLSERYTITLNILSYVAFASAICLLIGKLKFPKRLSMTGYISLSILLAASASTFRLDPYTNTFEAFSWAKAEGLLATGKVFLSRGIQVDSRFLFEHGPLKGAEGAGLYPNRIVTSLQDAAPDPTLPEDVKYAFVASADNKTTQHFALHPDFGLKKEFMHIRVFERRVFERRNP